MNKSFFRFCDYQKKFILDESKILVIEKGRQEGITWTAAYKIVREVHLSKNKQDYYWLSRDEALAKMTILDIQMWLQVFDVTAKAEDEELEILAGEEKGKKIQATKVTFENGSALYVLSSSVDACIGRRGSFILDEFAVHKDQEILFNLVMPAIKMGAFKLIIFSTHRSKSTFFYKLVKEIKEGKRRGTLMTITIEDAVNDGLVNVTNVRRVMGGELALSDEEFLAQCRGDASSEALFEQEYMCVPADADQVQAVTEEYLEASLRKMSVIAESEPRKGAKYFMGIDIGRHRDLTVITVLEMVEKAGKPHFIMRYQKAIAYTEFAKQEAMIFAEARRWKPYSCNIDGTTVGAQIAESLERRLSYCKSIKITSVSRPIIIGGLIRFIEKGIMQIFDTQDLWADFMCIERYISAKTGNVDYWIPSRGDKGHGDRFMSVALALYAATSKNNRIGRLLQNSEDSASPTEDKKAAIQNIGASIRANKRRFRMG